MLRLLCLADSTVVAAVLVGAASTKPAVAEVAGQLLTLARVLPGLSQQGRLCSACSCCDAVGNDHLGLGSAQLIV
jgi:hypothetical protein